MIIGKAAKENNTAADMHMHSSNIFPNKTFIETKAVKNKIKTQKKSLEHLLQGPVDGNFMRFSSR